MLTEKYRAVKIPLQGWAAQVWCEYTGHYEDLPISPTFRLPEEAVHWALECWD